MIQLILDFYKRTGFAAFHVQKIENLVHWRPDFCVMEFAEEVDGAYIRHYLVSIRFEDAP